MAKVTNMDKIPTLKVVQAECSHDDFTPCLVTEGKVWNVCHGCGVKWVAHDQYNELGMRQRRA